jgi:catechol 2,3-dioxygenase-like lactoylglutathione lyase family enzyme
MLKKVAYVALLVSDQDKALDFYTNVIGLEKRGDFPTLDGPRFLTVGVEGQDFDLVLWPGTPARGDLDPRSIRSRWRIARRRSRRLVRRRVRPRRLRPVRPLDRIIMTCTQLLV